MLDCLFPYRAQVRHDIDLKYSMVLQIALADPVHTGQWKRVVERTWMYTYKYYIDALQAPVLWWSQNESEKGLDFER